MDLSGFLITQQPPVSSSSTAYDALRMKAVRLAAAASFGSLGRHGGGFGKRWSKRFDLGNGFVGILPYHAPRHIPHFAPGSAGNA
jgi:hypothetical protein